ncbi:hypothetical protein ABZ953_09330, partial [Streptomyces sp. NPDC046465]
ALTEGQDFAGWARPAGVLAGGVLAWRRAPFAQSRSVAARQERQAVSGSSSEVKRLETPMTPAPG